MSAYRAVDLIDKGSMCASAEKRESLCRDLVRTTGSRQRDDLLGAAVVTAPGLPFPSPVAVPMVNEIALALLFGLFGWKVAVLYLGSRPAVAMLAGLVIGKRVMDSYLEDWVRAMQVARSVEFQVMRPNWRKRIDAGVVPSRAGSETRPEAGPTAPT